MTDLKDVRIQFAPAPSKTNRRDGWTEAGQRAFVAALARCASARAAARRVGKPVRGAGALPAGAGPGESRRARTEKCPTP